MGLVLPAIFDALPGGDLATPTGEAARRVAGDVAFAAPIFLDEATTLSEPATLAEPIDLALGATLCGVLLERTGETARRTVPDATSADPAALAEPFALAFGTATGGDLAELTDLAEPAALADLNGELGRAAPLLDPGRGAATLLEEAGAPTIGELGPMPEHRWQVTLPPVVENLARPTGLAQWSQTTHSA